MTTGAAHAPDAGSMMPSFSIICTYSSMNCFLTGEVRIGGRLICLAFSGTKSALTAESEAPVSSVASIAVPLKFTFTLKGVFHGD